MSCITCVTKKILYDTAKSINLPGRSSLNKNELFLGLYEKYYFCKDHEWK